MNPKTSAICCETRGRWASTSSVLTRGRARQDVGQPLAYPIRRADRPEPYRRRGWVPRRLSSSDAIVEGAVVRVVRTPIQAPNASAYAERFVRSIREECLDRVILFGERRLRRVLDEFVAHYHAERTTKGSAMR
jgi:hypothetical protein